MMVWMEVVADVIGAIPELVLKLTRTLTAEPLLRMQTFCPGLEQPLMSEDEKGLKQNSKFYCL
jgi:hypothetical protein